MWKLGAGSDVDERKARTRTLKAKYNKVADMSYDALPKPHKKGFSNLADLRIGERVECRDIGEDSPTWSIASLSTADTG